VVGCCAGGDVAGAVEPGAASGCTCGWGSGAGVDAACAAGATANRHTKTIALHPVGSPPRLRPDGAGAYGVATIQVTATPKELSSTSKLNVSPLFGHVNTGIA
jgi:hypothetical protein